MSKRLIKFIAKFFRKTCFNLAFLIAMLVKNAIQSFAINPGKLASLLTMLVKNMIDLLKRLIIFLGRKWQAFIARFLRKACVKLASLITWLVKNVIDLLKRLIIFLGRKWPAFMPWLLRYRTGLLKYNTIKYSLKIWLTSVLVSPLLFFVIILCKEGIYNSDLLHSISSDLLVYMLFVTAEILLSYGSWLTFLAAVSVLIVLPVKQALRKRLTHLTALLLTIVPFWAILYPGGSFLEIDYYIYFMLCSCVCTCDAVRYYKLKPILTG